MGLVFTIKNDDNKFLSCLFPVEFAERVPRKGKIYFYRNELVAKDVARDLGARVVPINASDLESKQKTLLNCHHRSSVAACDMSLRCPESIVIHVRGMETDAGERVGVFFQVYEDGAVIYTNRAYEIKEKKNA